MGAMKTALALLAFFLVAAPALAQSDPPSARCERAWLGSDWPGVVTECGAIADNDESAGMWEGFAIAGQAHAMVAVGYAKLGKKHLYASQRELALEDLSNAVKGAGDDTDALLRQKAISLQTLIDSPTFVHDAPDSDLFAHI